jgi:hypothetical protein
MYKIAIIGSKDYVRESNVAKFVKRIYDQFGKTATILSGGTDQGAERWAKKYSLEFSMIFKEYNPSYTGYRMYSAMDESYYGKGFHPSHFHDRYKHMIYEADRLVIFVERGAKLEPDLQYAIKQAEKKKIPFILVN